MKSLLAAIQSLGIFPAIGIVSFGWALSRLLHFQCARYAPLWFAGALLVYNVDRLKRDPADAINIPRRSERNARLRRAGAAIAAASACALIAIPLAMRDWLVLALTLAGACTCLNYSIPVFGFRLKDVPFLKTFFAPAVVAAACLALPALQQPMHVSTPHYAAAAAWTCAFLFFNMMLCDLRDIEGDRAMGTLSVPVFLGRTRTLWLLGALVALVAALAIATAGTAPPIDAPDWKRLAILATIYLGALLVAVRKPRAEWFYEWCVEGMLFLPAVVVVFRGMN
jgi:4-hydroxybenzoate polyprenyltransferase